MGCRIIWKFVVHPEPSKTFPSDNKTNGKKIINNEQRQKKFHWKSRNERPGTGTGRCKFLQQMQLVVVKSSPWIHRKFQFSKLESFSCFVSLGECFVMETLNIWSVFCCFRFIMQFHVLERKASILLSSDLGELSVFPSPSNVILKCSSLSLFRFIVQKNIMSFHKN